MADPKPNANPNAYQALIEKIFFDGYSIGSTSFEFEREDLPRAAEALGLARPRNLGDVIYSIRYRTALSSKILATQPENMEWIIEGAGRARYRFRLVALNRIKPREDLLTIGIPNATPEIIRTYALDDEQALLAIVRYNRLIDTLSWFDDLQPSKSPPHNRHRHRSGRN